mgnify:CR=1 FL=1
MAPFGPFQKTATVVTNLLAVRRGEHDYQAVGTDAPNGGEDEAHESVGTGPLRRKGRPSYRRTQAKKLLVIVVASLAFVGMVVGILM